MFFNLYWILFFYIQLLVFLLFLSFSYSRILSYFGFIIFFIIYFFFYLSLNYSDLNFIILIKFYNLNWLNISYIIGMDFLSISFILLCSFLLVYCLLIYWNLKYKINLYIFCLFFSLWLLLNVFSSLDLFFFYIYFEGIVIPMFFLIGIWGSRSRKIYASYQFFIYTLIGSIFVLLCFMSIYFNIGSSSFLYFYECNFFSNRALIFFLVMFLGFAVKIPTIPLHIWLPEAHVEAPTPGSVILAGILLKLGTYAILRLLLCLFKFNIYFDIIFFILTLSLVGFTYASMVALSQIDIKKIIAYSSIAHMNFGLFGLFSFNTVGIVGLIILMFGHAITSGALFLGVGVLYDRYKTRLIFYYGSLIIFMPLFAICYFIFILSNFGFPGTFNFVGEFLILIGGFYCSNVIIILSSFGMILTLIYSLSLYNRIFFGSLYVIFIRYYSEVSRLDIIYYKHFLF